MKYCNMYFDTEFTGLHRNTTLISIGIVSETGDTFYAEITDYNENDVNEWLKEHVIDNLLFNDRDMFIETTESGSCRMKGPHKSVGDILREWIDSQVRKTEKQARMFSDCYAYDWVLFNDLVCKDGLALNLPNYIHYIPMDLSTSLADFGYDPDISREEFAGTQAQLSTKSSMIYKGLINEDMTDPKHNALWDAYIIKACYDKLLSMKK